MNQSEQITVLTLSYRPSVCLCRAAGRRWGAGASFALQMSAASGTRHQTKGKAAPSRTTLERFVPSVPSAENGVGTRRAPIHAVSPVSPLSPVQMSVPRRQGTQTYDRLECSEEFNRLNFQPVLLCCLVFANRGSHPRPLLGPSAASDPRVMQTASMR